MRTFYDNVNTKFIADNHTFWKTVKSSFTDKLKTSQNITLVEGNDIVSNSLELVNIFSNLFSNTIRNLGISENPENITDRNSQGDLIEKYKSHPSIIRIQQNVSLNTKFKFESISCNTIWKIIKGLDSSKTTVFKSIPIRIFSNHAYAFVEKLTSLINHCILECSFPDRLKYADISPAFKQGDKFDKHNYRPVSLLPTVSKMFESILFSQLEGYIDTYLSKHLCGFRKGHNTQNCHMVMVENMKLFIHNQGKVAALLTDLLKAFPCIKHKILIAKLNSYGLHYDSLKLLYDYLLRRKQ